MNSVTLLPGIVTVDPDVPVDKTLIPSPPARPKNPVFENEEKSKVGTALMFTCMQNEAATYHIRFIFRCPMNCF